MRKRMVVYSLIISFMIQLVIGWNTFHNLLTTNKDLTIQTSKELIQQTSNNLTTYFQDLDALASLLRTSNISDYSRLYWNMHGGAVVNEKGEMVNHLLNELSLQENWVEKIFILGRNNNQSNFSKVIGEEGWSSEGLPSIDDLMEYSLLNILLKEEGIPTYHSREILLQTLEHSTKSVLNIPQLVRNLDFLKQVENRMTIAVYDDDVVILIVLPLNFMDMVLNKQLSDFGVKMQLVDADNNLLWRNEWDQSGNDNSEAYRFIERKSLSPYNFQMELLQRDSFYMTHKKSISILVVLLAINLGLSFMIAYTFSRQIFNPIKVISRSIQKDTNKMFPMRLIPQINGNKRWFIKMPLQRKMFWFLMCSVMFPVLIVGLIFSFASFQINKGLLIDSKEQMTQQLSTNVTLHKQSFKNLAHQLILQETYFENEAASVHPKMSDVSYYVVYDNKGSTKLSSIYGNNLELFPIKPSMLTKGAFQYDWIPLEKDIFGNHSASLVTSIMNNRDMDGYLDLILKEHGLVTNDKWQESELLLLDQAKQTIYQSNPDQTEFRDQRALRNLDRQNEVIRLDNKEYLRIIVPIIESEWLMINFVPLREIITDSQLLLVKHLYFILAIIVVGLLLSYILSKSLIKPLLKLHESMNQVSEGQFIPYDHDRNDEIGELAENYNQMISHINHLLEEQMKSNVREQALMSSKMKAELGMLQQQINPHFLYNTLESVKFRAMHNDSEGINKIVNAMADMLRYSVRGGSQEVSFSEELTHIQNYYTIQKMRLRDKLDFKWEIDKDALTLKVLKFVLQPLVENAIEHGILQVTTGGVVTISASVSEYDLIIGIKDNGVGLDEDELERLKKSLFEDEVEQKGIGGVGLKNVSQRLHLFYRGGAVLEIEFAMMKGTLVRLKIPLHR
ncbi:sensor histidine kinase [Paenibacillus sp. GCM10028914]|uniref:sensor histidine kinase n=1 Tax=Paenibacillus sp. GCM10028914 TaxID=3273416 RepID=UPI0036228E64